jgi:hypothetical protein
MFSYKDYTPYMCFGVVLFVLFLLWYFYGGKKYDFVGLDPLKPDTRAEYLGSVYDWGNQVCTQEDNFVDEPSINNETINNETIDNETVNETIDITPELDEVCMNVEETVCIPEPKKKRKKFVSKGEKICKETMEKFYNAEFINVRPSWLKNPETGRALELDCYNEGLRIAVEYNGEQHYKWPNFTNQSQQEFINQTRRDQLKGELCDKNGVYLITVPYNVPHDKIPAYITSRLPENILPENINP